MSVETDLSKYGSIIPDNECFISPIVDVRVPAETSTSSYILRIPHCLDEEDDRSKVKVRMIDESRKSAVIEVPKGKTGLLYYEIDAEFISLHTSHFTKVICSTCNKYHCREKIISKWYMRLSTQQLEPKIDGAFWKLLNWFIRNKITRRDVEIRSYFCSDLFKMKDFKKILQV